jgi:hypothetical protein
MFFHGGLSHILYNMLTFYWFGRIFSEFLGMKRLWGLYFLGGLAGGVFYVLVYNITNPDAVVSIPLVGASAAVMAVVVASGLRFPDYQMNLMFFGPVHLLWTKLLGLTKRRSKMTAHRGGAGPVNRPAAGTLTKDEAQRKTDAILDKISKTGYDNLTKEEKDFLFRVSNRH